MEAFILAAGLGTRLRPLTDHCPKALVKVDGKTMLEAVVERVAGAGVRRCVVNVHHFADMMVDYITSREWPCEMVVSDERDMLLDTGGALKHAAGLFGGKEPILVHNVDIRSDIDFGELERHHLKSGNLVTLCTSRRRTKRMLLFDKGGNLERRTEMPTETWADRRERAMAFSGVSMVSPRLFEMLPADDHPYPMIDCYIELAKKERIGFYEHDASNWEDLGKLRVES